MNPYNASTSPLLLPPRAIPPVHGPQRIALHSLFRIICEANQLTVNDVVNAFHNEILGTDKVPFSRVFINLQLSDAGSLQSHRLIAFMESATGMRNLLDCTLATVSGLNGGTRLLTCKMRKWCPHCYSQDLLDGWPPYDRLLWSVDLATFCPVHQVRLESVCRHCCRSFAVHPMGRDISGFCPYCQSWLGRCAGPNSQTLSEEDQYDDWCSTALAELIGCTSSLAANASNTFVENIRVLIADCHAGVKAHFARQIGRNKSVVASWLGAKAKPRWDVLCAISYAYHLPLQALLAGQVSNGAVQGRIRALPCSVVDRHIDNRRKPTARNLERMVSFMSSIQAGEHPEITSMNAVATHLGTNERELYRLASEAARKTSSALAVQAAHRRVVRAAQRLRDRDEAVRRLSIEFARSGQNVSRRAVESELAVRGYVVPWQESKEVLALVRRQTAVEQSEVRSTAADLPSGNSRSPHVSGTT